jgi:hypothetical protein
MGELKQRIGNFFILIGAMLLVLFFTSNASGAPNFVLLLAGIGSVLLGFRMVRRPPEDPSESRRFRTLRRLIGMMPRDEDEYDDRPFDRM